MDRPRRSAPNGERNCSPTSQSCPGQQAALWLSSTVPNPGGIPLWKVGACVLAFTAFTVASETSMKYTHARSAWKQLGYDGIFLRRKPSQLHRFIQALATCAMLTKRVLLGIAVTNMVFRHPTVLAGAAASLNEISKGRAILGLGTGDGPVYSQGRKATPLDEFETGVKMIRDLVQGKPMTFPKGEVGIGSISIQCRFTFPRKDPKACDSAAAARMA